MLLIGVLHAVTMMALPMVALVSNSTRRSKKLPRFATVLIVIGGLIGGFVMLQIVGGVIHARLAVIACHPIGSFVRP